MKKLLLALKFFGVFGAFAIFANAQAEYDSLKLARINFDYGRYQTAIEIIESLFSKKLLSKNSALLEAWRMHGLSNFYLGRNPQARSSFLKLLCMDPDYELDPLVIPPAAIMDFDDVREKNAKLLEPIRQRKRNIEQEKILAEKRKKDLLDAEERNKKENETMVFIQRVEKHHYLTDFLPFGAPQMEQNRMREGVLLGVGQGIALATTLVTYERTKSFIGADYTIPSDKLSAAKKWRAANWIAFAVTGALYVIGVVDAIWHHQDETVTWVPMPSRSPSISSPSSQKSSSKSPNTQFYAAPTPLTTFTQQGAQFGITGRF